jgi:hypothetical protein
MARARMPEWSAHHRKSRKRSMAATRCGGDQRALTRKPRGEAPHAHSRISSTRFPKDITSRIKQTLGYFMPGRARTFIDWKRRMPGIII